VEALREFVLELGPIPDDTKVASTRDSTIIGPQQSFGERERITDTQAE